MVAALLLLKEEWSACPTEVVFCVLFDDSGLLAVLSVFAARKPLRLRQAKTPPLGRGGAYYSFHMNSGCSSPPFEGGVVGLPDRGGFLRRFLMIRYR